MKPFIAAYFKISGFCVLLTLVLQSWTLKLLYEAGYKDILPNTLVGVLGGTGIYFFLYKLASWVYESWGWKYFFKQLNIDGVWFHLIETQSDDKYVRYGRTEIHQRLFSIQLNGMNYDTDFKRSSRSMWHSNAVTITEDGLLIFTYENSRAGESAQTEKTGLMRVHIHRAADGSPDRLEGIFQDSHPSHLRGSITWEREAPWANSLPSLQGSTMAQNAPAKTIENNTDKTA